MSNTEQEQMLSCAIPFVGFCEFWPIDAYETFEVENFCDILTNAVSPDNKDKLGDYWEFANYKKMRLWLAEDYVEYFSGETDISLSFKELISPREYNFTTDRVIAYIPLSDVIRIVDQVKKDQKTLLSVLSRHTSRSGFSSFYSDDLEHWLSLDPRELDEVEIETFILAFLKLNNVDWESICEDWCQSLGCNGEFDEFYDFDSYLEHIGITKEKFDEAVCNS